MFVIYPFKLKPVFKDYLWGGNRLRTDFNMDCNFDKIAEDWVLSVHNDGISEIENGQFKGRSLKELIDNYGEILTGSNCNNFNRFPLMVKLIDAKDNLSLQVHPTDDYALKYENDYGKSEMWYIADCEENSEIIYGFKQDISKDEFRQRIKDNTLLDVLKKVPVKKGDVFFIEAGTVHAIGKGILIVEIQQNSNLTYRLYDYNRKDANGKTRELHIDKALETANLSKAINPAITPHVNENSAQCMLASCKYFTSYIFNIETEKYICADKTSFVHLLIIDGQGCIKNQSYSENFKKGDSFFIPSGYEINISGKCSIIATKTGEI